MIIDKEYLTNQIHASVEGVKDTGFPIDVFPNPIQNIVF